MSVNKKHGMSSSPTYKSWESMMARCYYKKAVNYRRYGGAGISVCEKWKTFAGFFEDMGARPTGKTLDRYPHTAKIYSKETCRWATILEQAQNRKPRSKGLKYTKYVLSGKPRKPYTRSPATLKTHCLRGHPRTPENLWDNSTCIPCSRMRAAERAIRVRGGRIK